MCESKRLLAPLAPAPPALCTDHDVARLTEKEQLEAEEEAVRKARQDRVLGMGVGRIENDYTKILTHGRGRAQDLARSPGRPDKASWLLDTYLRTQG